MKNFWRNRTKPAFGGVSHGLLSRIFCLLCFFLPQAVIADNIFLYSSQTRLYGINLDTQQETYLTQASLSASINALAANSTSGLMYYGDASSIYYWDPALGTGANSHALINSFENGFFQAPIRNINSTGGSFLNGKYYIGSEDDNGFIEEVYELTMSANGRQMVGMRALNISAACNCSKEQLGGFGDLAVIEVAGSIVMYGSSADLTTTGEGTHAGIWRFDLIANVWELLAPGDGGQLASTLDGRLFTNVGQSVREVSIATGATSTQNLMTTSQAIWDFTGGYSYDFGDAPDSYGAATHLVSPGVGSVAHLGILRPDNEPYSLHSGVGGIDGAGDDSDGIDDEDGLSVVPQLMVGDSSSNSTVSCNGGSVVAWIDFNLNGQFDFNERNSNYPVQCSAASNGTALLEWSNFTIPTAGTSYMRIRSATNVNEIYKPTGYVDNGEVEDYRLQFSGGVSNSGNCPAGEISYIYQSSDVPVTYSGNRSNPITSIITVPDSLIVTDVNILNLSASHRRQRGLYWYLQKDSQRVLMYGNSCWDNRNLNVSIDDEATSDFACPPASGATYRSVGPLSAFDGINAQGTWSLQVENNRRNNRGQINAWSLEICAADPSNTNSEIRLGKVADVVDRNVTITLLAKNVGQTPLNDIQLVDNLDVVFGAGNYVITSLPEIVFAPASGFVANTAFTGQAGSDQLLSASGVLNANDELRMTFSVDVGFSGTENTNVFENQAQANAVDENGNDVNDLSATGLDMSNDQDSMTVIGLDGVVQIEGVVFNDTSSNPLTSHDGVQQAQENGVAGRAVSVVDVASGNEIASAVTTADGSWSAQIDSSYLNQTIDIVIAPISNTEFVSEMPMGSDASNADGRVRFLLQADVNANRTYVGVINRPSLVLNQTSNIQPGASAVYNHRYESPTHGTVSFNVTATSSNPGSNWVENIYHDLNCNDQVDGTDYLINAAIDAAFDTPICIYIEVVSSATANAGETHTLDITANMQVADLSATAHGISFSNTNQDITSIISAGVGNLVLEKSVRNISLGGQSVNQNTALPGHVLEYTINYSNTGAGNINDLVINDEAPAFTQIDPSSAQCTQTPAALQCAPDVNGTQVQWLFQGTLPPSNQGSVSYRIVVE